MPPTTLQGRRYPLVIQTHGFFKEPVISSGGLTSAVRSSSLGCGRDGGTPGG